MTTPDIAALRKLVEMTDQMVYGCMAIDGRWVPNTNRRVVVHPIRCVLPAAREALERVEDLLQQDIHGLCVEANDYIAVKARSARLESLLDQAARFVEGRSSALADDIRTLLEGRDD
jgi:hypothetical protein